MADTLEFPRLVHKGSEKRRVETKAEFDKALSEGFTEHADPPPGSPAAEAEPKPKAEPKAEPKNDPKLRGKD